jgi:PAS domain S-box-containing protein
MKRQLTHLLLIEDSPADARLIMEMLKEEGEPFKLEWAKGLSSALEEAATQNFDLILLDLGLPGSQGEETFAQTYERALAVPIIILTGLDDKALATDCVQRGAQDFLIKGQFDAPLLIRAIRYAIERHRFQEALRKSEERYRLLAENASDVIWITDLELNVIYASPSIERLRGYTPEEVMAQAFEETVTPTSLEIARTALAEELVLEQSGQGEPDRVRTIELEYTCKDGSTIWTEGKVSFLRDPEGWPIAITGVTRDITARKRAEEALRKNEAWLSTTLQSIGDAVIATDTKGTVRLINPIAQSLTGWGPEEASGKPLREVFRIVNEETGLPCESPVEKVLREGVTVGLANHTLLIARDGARIPIADSGAPIRDEQGEVIGVVLVFRDVTERRQAERALEESEERHRRLIESMDDLVFSVDRAGVFHTAGGSRLVDFGLKPEDVVGRSLADLFPQEEASGYQHRHEQVFEGGEALTYEHTFEFAGVMRTDLTTVYPIKNEQGEVEQVGGICRDITERKQAEEALREERDRAQQYLDIAGVTIVVLDATGKVTLINKKGCEILGYTEEEILGRDWFSHFLPERNRDVVRSTFDQLMTGEIAPAKYYENPVLTKAGEERLIAWHNTVLGDETGQIVGTLSSGEEITERKQAETMLQAQRDLGLALTAAYELDETLRICLDVAIRSSGLDCGGIYLVDDGSGDLHLAHHRGLPSGFIASASHFGADSANARIVLAGKPLYTRHPEMGVPLDKVRQREGLGAIAILPVPYAGQIIACLNVASHTLDQVPEFARTTLEAIASQIGNAIARAQAEEQIRHQAETLAALHETALELAAHQAQPDLLEAIVVRAVELLKATGGGMYLYRPASDDLEYVYTYKVAPKTVGIVLQRGEGLSGKVLEKGQAMTVTNYSHWDGRSPQFEGDQLDASIAVPIRWGDRILGVLNLDGDAPRTFTPQDIALLERFTPLAAAALENTRLLGAEKQRRQVAETLQQAATVLNSTLELRAVLDLILEQLQRVIPYDSASVQQLFDENLQIVAVHGFQQPDKITGLTFTLDPKFPNCRVIETKAPVAIGDVPQDYPVFREEAQRYGSGHIRSWLGIPLVVKERILGMIALDRTARQPFTAEESNLVQIFANQAAIAMENARLYSDLQEQMDELTSAQAQLVQSAKLAAIGELAAGVAHELNNPLTSILGFAEILEQDLKEDEFYHRNLQTIVNEAHRARRIVRGLLDFARQRSPERRPANVNQILQQTLNVIRYHLEKSRIVIEENYATDLAFVSLDEGQIKQVFLNLISNAAQAMPEGGTLHLQTAQIDHEATVSFTDSGAGISVEDRDRIFDPFFSTKTSGTGLGLSVSLGIVESHEGGITVESQIGKGSTFTVWLPTE